MKVLLINGSPHEYGCTYTGLKEISDTLNQEGIETEIVWLTNKATYGCSGCGYCRKKGKCVHDDLVNTINDRADEFDGLVVGSAVHYAAASGTLTAFMDRLFYSGSKKWRYKPACAIVSCRRSGSTATFEQLNKYFTINQMPVVSSIYWNGIHGYTVEDVLKDEEGLQTMRYLGHNMAWLIKCIDLGKKNDINPTRENERFTTNFIK